MLIPAGTMASICVATWWLGRWMKGIDARLEAGDQRFERIERKLDSLLCSGDCPKPKHK